MPIQKMMEFPEGSTIAFGTPDRHVAVSYMHEGDGTFFTLADMPPDFLPPGARVLDVTLHNQALRKPKKRTFIADDCREVTGGAIQASRRRAFCSLHAVVDIYVDDCEANGGQHPHCVVLRASRVDAHVQFIADLAVNLSLRFGVTVVVLLSESQLDVLHSQRPLRTYASMV